MLLYGVNADLSGFLSPHLVIRLPYKSSGNRRYMPTVATQFPTNAEAESFSRERNLDTADHAAYVTFKLVEADIEGVYFTYGHVKYRSVADLAQLEENFSEYSLAISNYFAELKADTGTACKRTGM